MSFISGGVIQSCCCCRIVLMANGLKLLQVSIPPLKLTGQSARLACLYDLEGDTLYSIKWLVDEQLSIFHATARTTLESISVPTTLLYGLQNVAHCLNMDPPFSWLMDSSSVPVKKENVNRFFIVISNIWKCLTRFLGGGKPFFLIRI